MTLSADQLELIRRVAIVVPSCDEYSDLWEAFFQTLRMRWKTCPFYVYLVSNRLDFLADGVTTIKVGEDRTWSANLIRALASVMSDYVLLFMDDLFLSSDVDDKRIVALIGRCVSERWDYLRLNPTPGPQRAQSIGGGVGRILPGDWYRSSTVLAVWKKEVLLDVLDSNENAWEFEIFGDARTDKYKQWFACERQNLSFYNLVIKGKMDRLSLYRLQSSGVRIVTARPIMTPIETLLFLLRRIRSILMILIPRGSRRKLRSLFSAI
jgi:hypothetical protein